MKTSRQRVLDYIEQHRVATIADISRAMQMTPANARHHVSILEDQGLVEVIGKRAGPGRGRPSNLYGIAEQAVGNNLSRLAGALLDELLADRTPAEVQVGIERLAARLVDDLCLERGESKPAGNLTQRLYSAVQCLNEMRYQSRWEARAEGPRLILEHCPYAAILEQHPELCRMDEALIEDLVGNPVRLSARLVRDARGNPHCIFLMGEKGDR